MSKSDKDRKLFIVRAGRRRDDDKYETYPRKMTLMECDAATKENEKLKIVANGLGNVTRALWLQTILIKNGLKVGVTKITSNQGDDGAVWPTIEFISTGRFVLKAFEPRPRED